MSTGQESKARVASPTFLTLPRKKGRKANQGQENKTRVAGATCGQLEHLLPDLWPLPIRLLHERTEINRLSFSDNYTTDEKEAVCTHCTQGAPSCDRYVFL
eukprot:g9731.t1